MQRLLTLAQGAAILRMGWLEHAKTVVQNATSIASRTSRDTAEPNLQVQKRVGSLLLSAKLCKLLLNRKNLAVFYRCCSKIANAQYSLQAGHRHANEEESFLCT